MRQSRMFLLITGLALCISSVSFSGEHSPPGIKESKTSYVAMDVDATIVDLAANFEVPEVTRVNHAAGYADSYVVSKDQARPASIDAATLFYFRSGTASTYKRSNAIRPVARNGI